jgi:hypothetical protein
MSFYFQEDDDDEYNRTNKNSTPSFVCPTCGGTQSYQQEEGHVYCSLCQSQSQVTSVVEGALELEDVEALMARTRRGHIVSIRQKNRSVEPSQKPLSDYNISTPLPSLQDCLTAFTQIVQASLERLCTQVLQLPDYFTQRIQRHARQTWLQYLTSWQEGQAFYQHYHPQVRISLRDAFVHHAMHRGFLYRHLAHQATKKVQNETKDDEEGEEGEESNDENEEDGNDDNEEESNDEEEEDHPSSNQDLQRHSKSTQQGIATLKSMLNLYKRKGHKEAALHLQPDMVLVAALLWVPLRHAGITAQQVCQWIAQGDLPLLNAYQTLLSPNLQSTLKLIPYAFRLDRPPPVAVLEYRTKLLLAASKQDLALLPITSIPLIVSKWIQDYVVKDTGQQLQQHGVRRCALALMGIELASSETSPAPSKKNAEDSWIPSALKALRKVTRLEQVAAAVVVAWKLCGGPIRHRLSNQVIPWNPDQVMLLKPHPMTYLDFCEAHMLRRECTVSTEGFLTTMTSSPSRNRKQEAPSWTDVGVPLDDDTNSYDDKYQLYPKDCPFNTTHPHYQFLVERMSYIAGVQAMEIHKIVLKLDLELLLLYQKNSGRKRKRK